MCALVSEGKINVGTSEPTLKTVLPLRGTVLLQLQVNAMRIVYELDDHVNQNKFVCECSILGASAVVERYFG